MFRKWLNSNVIKMDHKTIDTTPFQVSTEIKAHFVKIGKQQGNCLTDEPFKWRPYILFFINTSFLFSTCKGFGFMFYEHYRGRSYFLGDCRTLIIAIGFIATQSYGLFLLYHREKVYTLLNWCEQISSEVDGDQQKYYKFIKNLQTFKIVNVTFVFVGPIITYLMTKERILPIPYYAVEEAMPNTGLFLAFFVLEMIADYCFWQSSIFAISFYYIMVQYISAQYKTLSHRIMSSCTVTTITPTNDGKTVRRSVLDEVGAKHADLLTQINQLSSIFTHMLMFNEALAVLAIVVSMVTFQYASNEVGFGVSAAFVGSSSLVYPFLGQEISSSAEDFAEMVFYGDWLNLSHSNRKKLSLILMVAQKPVGIETGGFHFANFLEIGQVKKINLQKLTYQFRIMFL